MGAQATTIRLQRRQLENLRQRLHLLLVRHQEELQRSVTQGETSWSSEFEAIRATLKEMMGELQKIQAKISQETGVCLHLINESRS